MSASHPPCKSELMLLSEKFRDRFASSTGREAEKRIDLNDCALALGVPRRRLYDITIVYEAAEVISCHSLKCRAWKSIQSSPLLCKWACHIFNMQRGMPQESRVGCLASKLLR